MTVSETLQVIFWRIAAQFTGIAVRNQTSLKTALRYSPILLAGALAYLLGRTAGLLILQLLA